MRFRQLEYQDRVLAALDVWIDHLNVEKQESENIAKLASDNPHLAVPIPDFTKKAWKALKALGSLPESRKTVPFSPRKDGCGRPVPNTVLKVPTGGGKNVAGRVRPLACLGPLPRHQHRLRFVDRAK